MTTVVIHDHICVTLLCKNNEHGNNKKLLQYLLNMEHLCFFFKEYGAYLFMAYIAELFEPYGPLDYASQ